MITVPYTYSKSVELLLETPTGKALVLNARLENVKVVIDVNLDAHGKTIDRQTICINNKDYSIPNMACILAHELTHCHDLAYSGKDDFRNNAEIDIVSLGHSEVNAHFNQGQILRELEIHSADFKQEIKAAINGNTVFGQSYDWKTRDSVISYLLTTQQYSTCANDPMISFWSDVMWVSPKLPFHCDENWDIYVKSHSK